jgi:hypothetical protein
MSLRLYSTRSVALIKPKCFEVDTRRLKIDTPMVSMYFHG